jgi:putative toxin-antitoxin system antitoxin component (TIGR02293 family)
MADIEVVMHTLYSKRDRIRRRIPKAHAGVRTLRIVGGDAIEISRQIHAGFSFSSLARLQKAMGLPWERISHFVGIAPRTLTRREAEGKLRADESDRVLRAASIFEMTLDLFEGNISAARQWLLARQAGLGGEVPLEFASTEVGAREVENLIGRLEHGVFT